MVIIGTIGAAVGEILQVRTHPNAHKLWLAHVRFDAGPGVQIVFGGIRKIRRGDLVPVAPPGARVMVEGHAKPKKVRARRYRGERSHGMLCSLRELGWVLAGMDEVAVLCNVRRGQSLDDIAAVDRSAYVKNWYDATEPVAGRQ